MASTYDGATEGAQAIIDGDHPGVMITVTAKDTTLWPIQLAENICQKIRGKKPKVSVVAIKAEIKSDSSLQGTEGADWRKKKILCVSGESGERTRQFWVYYCKKGAVTYPLGDYTGNILASDGPLTFGPEDHGKTIKITVGQ